MGQIDLPQKKTIFKKLSLVKVESFETSYRSIGIKSFLSKCNTSNSCLKYPKSISPKILTKVSDEELKNLKLLRKTNLSSRLSSYIFLIHLVWFHFKIEFSKFLHKRCGSQFFRLWYTMEILQFRLTLILQSLRGASLYIRVMRQWSYH